MNNKDNTIYLNTATNAKDNIIKELLKELKRSNAYLKLKQKVDCNCNLSHGVCSLCDQIVKNNGVIRMLENVRE